MTSNSEHPFIVHPSYPRKETCRLCLAEVQAKKEVVESSNAPTKEKQKRLKSCEDQLKRMYWEISKKAAERNRHLCYCRHADVEAKERARRIQGIDTAPRPGPSAIPLPTFRKKSISLEDTPDASERRHLPSEESQKASTSPKRKRASRTVAGRVQSYRDTSEDEGLEGEAPSKPPPKKTKVRVEKQESSHSSDSDSDSQEDFNDYFAPSTTSSSRSRSRSTTGTPLSAHQFTSTFSRLTTTASPAPPVYSANRPTIESPASTSKSRSQSLPSNREESLLIDRIEHHVSSTIRECQLPTDTQCADENDTRGDKRNRTQKEKQPPNIPLMVYKLQEAMAALKELAGEGHGNVEVAKAAVIAAQHLQSRLRELQTEQGVKPSPLTDPQSADVAMWARLEKEVEMDEKLAKRKARAARGYSPSQPYYEDSDGEIQVL